MLRDILIYLSAFIGLFAVIFYFLGLFGKKEEINEKISDSGLPTVSIIIPAYNEERGIVDTIKSALSLDYPRDKLRVVVVDDGSKDKTYELARSVKSSLVSVFTKKNGGKGTALNYGIKKSGSEIIVTMDADTIVEADSLKRMVALFARKEVMCVTPAMVINNPHGFWVRIQQIEYFLGLFLRKAFANMNAIHITPGAFSAYRKSFFDKYGGYDEDNITEDLEIALRMQSHNFVIENNTEAVVYTNPPRTFYPLLKQRKRWYNGLMTNLWKYRRMFSPGYGDLGLVVLPVAVITIVLSVILTVYVAVKSVLDIWHELTLFQSINFDVSNYFSFSRFIVDRFLFNIFSNPIFVIAILFLLILAGYMIFAKSKVKKNAGIKLSFVWFVLAYSFLFAFWWIVSIIDTIFRRRVSWR